MALFDPDNPRSCALPWALNLASRLSECVAFQNLAEQETAEAAARYITVGHDDRDRPLTGAPWTAAQLAQRHFRALVLFDPEGAATSQRGRQQGRNHLGSQLYVDIKRQIRRIEHRDLNDVYKFFADRVYAIQETELMEKAEEAGHRPWIQTVVVSQGPFRNLVKKSSAQGDYLWAHLTIRIGRGQS